MDSGELHGFDGQVAMTNAHDDAVFGFSGDFQAGRKGFARANKECSGPLEILRQAFEDTTPRGDVEGCVHRIVEYTQFAAKCLHDSLQAEAHAENRDAVAHGGEHRSGTPKSRTAGAEKSKQAGATS